MRDKTILGVIIKLSLETIQITLTRFNTMNLKTCSNGMLKNQKMKHTNKNVNENLI